jgi:hypothetical protein
MTFRFCVYKCPPTTFLSKPDESSPSPRPCVARSYMVNLKTHFWPHFDSQAEELLCRLSTVAHCNSVQTISVAHLKLLMQMKNEVQLNPVMASYCCTLFLVHMWPQSAGLTPSNVMAGTQTFCIEPGLNLIANFTPMEPCEGSQMDFVFVRRNSAEGGMRWRSCLRHCTTSRKVAV